MLSSLVCVYYTTRLLLIVQPQLPGHPTINIPVGACFFVSYVFCKHEKGAYGSSDQGNDLTIPSNIYIDPISIYLDMSAGEVVTCCFVFIICTVDIQSKSYI